MQSLGHPAFGPFVVEQPICARASVELLRATYFPPGGHLRVVALRRTRPLSDGAHDEFVKAAGFYAVLRHADVVPVLDFGSLENRSYVATPLVPGYSLLHVLGRCARQQMGFPTDVALFIVRRALAALAYAHDQGQWHGDLGHTNIIVTSDGSVRLTDFGLRLVSTRRRSPRGLTVGPGRGLAAYIAPEQARGGPVSPATDIFAVGIVLYELISGRRLFSHANEAKIIDTLSRGTFEVPIDRYRPDLHPALKRVLIKALAPEAKDRFSDATSFVTAIDDLVDQVGITLSRVFLKSLLEQLFEASTGLD